VLHSFCSLRRENGAFFAENRPALAVSRGGGSGAFSFFFFLCRRVMLVRSPLSDLPFIGRAGGKKNRKHRKKEPPPARADQGFGKKKKCWQQLSEKGNKKKKTRFCVCARCHSCSLAVGARVCEWTVDFFELWM
jgi:hypothetical protein